jgi:hypothetical protein
LRYFLGICFFASVDSKYQKLAAILCFLKGRGSVMDPITLATVTSAVTLLASECGKGLASEGGKDLWKKIKSKLGWDSDPSPEDIAPKIAGRLERDDALLTQIVGLLKAQPAGTASQIVGSIQAERVVAAQQVNVAGDFHM